MQALETLAVIAYKQPITAPEITEIRGVNTAGVISTLIERQLVKIVGRKQVVGRPFMYSTTREFLIRFGLRDLSDLPKIEEMAEALGFEVPAGLSQPAPSQAQLDLSMAPHRSRTTSRCRPTWSRARKSTRLTSVSTRRRRGAETQSQYGFENTNLNRKSGD